MYGKIIQEKESDLGCESTGFVTDVWFLCFFIVESSDGNRAFDPCPWEVNWVLEEERTVGLCRGIFVFSGVQVSIFYWCWVSSWKEKEPLGCGSVSWWESLYRERWRKEMRSWKEKEPLEWFGTVYELNCHYILKQITLILSKTLSVFLPFLLSFACASVRNG